MLFNQLLPVLVDFGCSVGMQDFKYQVSKRQHCTILLNTEWKPHVCLIAYILSQLNPILLSEMLKSCTWATMTEAIKFRLFL